MRSRDILGPAAVSLTPRQIMGETGDLPQRDPEMKGTGHMTSETEVPPAGTRIVNGVAMISNGEKELRYPDTAADLIILAMENGWGFDSGLPAKISQDDMPYVRILIGREPGWNALTEGVSPGIQFHISWRMYPGPRKGWSLGQIYVKTSECEGWQVLSMIKNVRALISGHPVKMPDVYVSENY